jgi:cytoskeleton protein RodZ
MFRRRAGDTMVRLNPRSLRVLNQEVDPDAIHSVEGADHVGSFLREARENTGRSVTEVAQTLRIRRVYIEAIEDGRFNELPGATYAVGFIRSYATYLRLEVPDVLLRFKEEATGIQSRQDLDFPTPVPEGRFPGGVLVAVCLVLAAAGAGGWYWWQDQNSLEIVRVPPPPAGLTGSSDGSIEIATATPNTAGVPTVIATVTPPVSEQNIVAQEDGPKVLVSVATPEIPVKAEPAPAAPSAVVNQAETFDGPVEDMRVAAVETPPAEPEILLVPPSYLEPAIDPLGNVELPSLTPEERASAAGGETPAAETTAPTIAQTASAEPAAEEIVPEIAPAPVPQPVRPHSDLNVGVALPPDNAGPSTTTTALPAIPEPAPAAAADGRTYGVVNRDARIVVSARDADTWVQVMDSQENALLTQMLRPGDRYLVPNRPGLSLRTNNAGGLDIQVDGELVPAIGGHGDIRRDVRLDPGLLKTGTATIQ